MDFRLLGAFDARHDGAPVATGLRRQERCLLAALLLAPGRVVPTSRLVELLWDTAPPASPRGAIHTYMGRLRRSLEPFGVRISTRGEGYRVEPGDYRVDVTEFTDLARGAARMTDPAERVAALDRALALWRGRLLADSADDRARDQLDPALDEMWLGSVELRGETHLSLGQHDRVVSDLLPLAERHPTRERLIGVLMLALYRCGLQGEALERYRRTATVLSRELGVEPGPELRTRHEEILRNDPRLDRPSQPVYHVRVRGQLLPWTTSGHPALEFCNTYAGWSGPRLPGSEWLRGYATLAVWAGHHGLADDWTVTRLLREATRDPLAAAGVLDEARDLRRHLYACLLDAGSGKEFAAVARYVEAAVAVSTLVPGEDGLGRWALVPAAGLRLPIHAVARSAGDLLVDPRRFTVRACPSPYCGWLFLDSTGQRRWCGMAACGAAPARTELAAS